MKSLCRQIIHMIISPALLFLISKESTAVAENWQNLVQPIGTLAQVWAPNQVNTLLKSWDPYIVPGVTDPFDLNTAVTEIQPTIPQHFVRVYYGGDPKGAWMMRAQFVRGLTAEQIRDRFSLPLLPTHIVNIEVPSGSQYGLWTGIAEPIHSPGYEWGNGGAQQTRVIYNLVDFPNYARLPVSAFQHPQALQHFALAYTPMAEGRTAESVASYLDRFIPQPYSDMEDVYTALDFLNWVDFGPQPLSKALEEISPRRYATLPFLAWRNQLLFTGAVLNRFRQCQEGECACAPVFQLSALGELGNGEVAFHGANFDYHTWGIAGAFDIHRTVNFVAGGAFSGMMNNFSWKRHGGNGRVKHFQGALYGNYCHSCYFFGGMVSAGWGNSSTRRTILFPGVDRQARGHQNSTDFSISLQEGLHLNCGCWQLTPLFRVSYSQILENHFKEHCADSLNLSVRSWKTQVLRAYLEGMISRKCECEGVSVVPQVYVAYAFDSVLGGKHVGAGLDVLGGSFKTKVWSKNQGSFIGGVDVEVVFGRGMNGFVRYEAQANERYRTQYGEVGIGYVF